MTPRRGLVALGDSITRGRGGAPVLGVHPQSWVLWLAEALGVPVTNLGVDGARAGDVLREQVPRLEGPYDLATLQVGANDARSTDFEPEAFDAAAGAVVRALAGVAERVLVLTVPLDLGRPRAGAAKVGAANEALRAHAAAAGALVCDLDDLRGPPAMLPDAVHPTSPGMVRIADRAAATLAAAGVVVPARPSTLAHAAERTDPVARARFAGWYARQVARDRRRQAVERWKYRQASA
jgi:lysophospholipase L1-like esterase